MLKMRTHPEAFCGTGATMIFVRGYLFHVNFLTAQIVSNLTAHES